MLVIGLKTGIFCSKYFQETIGTLPALLSFQKYFERAVPPGEIHNFINSSFMAWVIMQIQSQNYTNISVKHQNKQNTITFPFFVLGCQALVAWPFTRAVIFYRTQSSKRSMQYNFIFICYGTALSLGNIQ